MSEWAITLISLSRTVSFPRPVPLGDAVNANTGCIFPHKATRNLQVTINVKKRDKKQQQKQKRESNHDF